PARGDRSRRPCPRRQSRLGRWHDAPRLPRRRRDRRDARPHGGLRASGPRGAGASLRPLPRGDARPRRGRGLHGGGKSRGASGAARPLRRPARRRTLGHPAQFRGDGGAAMSAPVIKGWCPGALRPMLSGDGLVVRVRPCGGRLTQAQGKGIADLSARHGNGLIDLSARANIQLRGISEADHGRLIEGLAALGLIDETTEVESRRNITVTPFWRHGDGVQEVVTSLAGALGRPDAPPTPGKFGYAVDCGAEPVLSEISADIRIERGPGGALLVRPDGAATGAAATLGNAATLAVDLAHWFLATGGAPDGRGR